MSNYKNTKWDFEAPKFWDLSETITQNRPDHSWFCNKNISAPSFGAPKKRRPLRLFQYSSKNLFLSSQMPSRHIQPITNNAQTEQNYQESVFDRLSKESTISFSKKTNQSLTLQQKQHLVNRHDEKLGNEEQQYELNVESSRATVGERVARLDGIRFNQNRKASIGKKNAHMKKAMDQSNQSISKPQPQTLYEEMQRYNQAAAGREGSTLPQQSIMLSPVRPTIPMSPQYTMSSQFAMSPRIPMSAHSSSPIRKSNQPEKKLKEEKLKKVLTSFFNGIIEKNKLREETRAARLKKYFVGLIERSKAIHKKMENQRSKEQQSAAIAYIPSKPLQFSPRKRTMTPVGAVENKKARFELKKSTEKTGHLSTSEKSTLTYERSNP